MSPYLLNEAAVTADLEAVRALIAEGAPLNELDELGHTPLHWAVFGGYEEIVQALLEAGANPNAFAADGVTPKWRANDFGLVKIELLLASYGGLVATNNKFDRNAFCAFNELMGLPLPREEPSKTSLLAAIKSLRQYAKRWLNKRKRVRQARKKDRLRR
jgi:ankyrin repeat protein